MNTSLESKAYGECVAFHCAKIDSAVYAGGPDLEIWDMSEHDAEYANIHVRLFL